MQATDTRRAQTALRISVTVKHLYFSCILISRFSSVKVVMHFYLAFSQGVLCNVKFQVTLAMYNTIKLEV